MPQVEVSPAPERLPARIEPELSLVPRARPDERALKLYAEARLASFEHLVALETAIGETRALAEAVVDGGDLYGPGVQDLARRLTEELFWRGKSLEAFRNRLAPAGSAR